MENYNVVIKPLVTEQSMHFANAKGCYSFHVHQKANKTEIKNAIEKIYSVKVDKVRTSNRKGKVKRKGRTFGETPHWKKAVVYLKPEFHIDLF
jgi:large subunit ribosomal protein L23